MPKQSKLPYTTNEEFVAHMMRFSHYGALSQMFIVESIRKYAEAVAAAPLDELGPEDGLINREAWQGVAKEIKSRCDEFYDRSR